MSRLVPSSYSVGVVSIPFNPYSNANPVNIPIDSHHPWTVFKFAIIVLNSIVSLSWGGLRLPILTFKID